MKGHNGHHQLAIGNQLASWFPIQVDANQGPRVVSTKRESKKGAPGLHQLAIGNQLASWFPIQVDANQGPRVVRLMFQNVFLGVGVLFGIENIEGA